VKAATLRWAWRTAWRDARGSRGQAAFCAFSMALGIAALVAMGSFGADLDRAVRDQTKELIGADLTVQSRQPFSPRATAFLDAIPGATASLTRFASMAFFPETGETQLSRIRAIEGEYPFYGALKTEPAEAATAFRAKPAAIVERALMVRVGAEIGDVVRLGQREFVIEGMLTGAPGEPPIASLMGPRIYIPAAYLEETGLIQRGSRIVYTRAFKLPAGVDADALIEPQRELLREERLSASTVATRRAQLGRAMGDLTRFLNLTACLALLLGALGVAGAVHSHIKRKSRQIAAMRCLGATVRQAAAVFMLQVMTIALLAAAIGAALGVAIQFLLPKLVAELLPFSFEPMLQPTAAAAGVGWGLLMSLLLAAAPLAAVRRISPLLSFRPELANAGRDWFQVLIYATAAGTWWVFASAQLQSALEGLAFVAALLAAVTALYAVAKLLSWLAQRLLSPRLPFAWRHGLASLFRPRNQTSLFMIILGMGVFLTAALASSRAMLLDQFEVALEENRANFIAFDIQPDQVADVTGVIEELGLSPGDAIPLVPMFLTQVKGRPIAELLKQPDIPEWMLRREYRSTYRAALGANEELIEGEWAARASLDDPEIPVSVEADLANALGLGLGDGFEMDVMGLPLNLRVASLRQVDWQSMQPNFYVVFPAGVLEEAPQMYLQTARVRSPEESARLQSALATQFPNVSCVDLTQIIDSIDQLLNKAAAVIRFLAGLCIGAGFLLLASAIWNGRYERLGEYALLRTLGASRRQMAQTALTEHFFLGLFAALAGLLLAAAASWGLGRFFFESRPLPDWGALLPPILLLPLMTLALGYAGLRGLWRASPRTVLRQEG